MRHSETLTGGYGFRLITSKQRDEVTKFTNYTDLLLFIYSTFLLDR